MPKILIVDDDDLLRGTLADFLQEQGYECIPAENVAKARGHLSTNKFELTLSDFNMPAESGLDLLRYVKSSPFDTPFILMSSEANAGLKREALGLGAAACLAKPFKLQELLMGIQSALCVARSASQFH
ncbi:MAG: response regulator [Syntrophobacteraceae bacterium]